MTTFVTVGANRVYARLNREFSYENWIAALKQGRTFVTNSPVLSFTVNGQDPGSTLRLDSQKDKIVQVHAVAESQLPLSGTRSRGQRRSRRAGQSQRGTA
jgi:hypothetical protein